jgi:N-acetyl-anhydromuramyl-L-alanine amidase AmpD
MRPITEIIIHCTATKPDWMAGKPTADKVAEVRRWHVEERKWKDIGYHYLIDRYGAIVEGRPVEQVGAHVQGHNIGSIGICLIGGFGGSADDKFTDHFTLEQDTALRVLLAKLKAQFAVTKVTGHNEYAAKACPSFRVSRWLTPSLVKKKRASVAQSTTVQASAVQAASAVGAGVSAVSALSGTAQIVALIFCGVIVIAAAWIMRERLRKWAEGDR